ncbi:Glycine--tRNA ligase alpha subunit [Nymphon striatum]|nr:Glycine--tRNA ligase alpha subunit [Nymphon striatum]
MVEMIMPDMATGVALTRTSVSLYDELYLGSLEAIGIDPMLHDIRFVEDDWESPTLGAWGLGWEVWCDGMEVSQFTYFQQGDAKISYGDVFQQTEREYSRWNFDVADTETLLKHFEDAEAECQNTLAQDDIDPKNGKKIVMAHPAYDQAIKASHVFNLLDARGVISVTERQSYILRVRKLAQACGEAFLKTEAGGACGA